MLGNEYKIRVFAKKSTVLIIFAGIRGCQLPERGLKNFFIKMLFGKDAQLS